MGCQAGDDGATVATRDQLLPGAFTADELSQIRNAVRARYSDTARSAEGKFKYPTGRDGARALNYDQRVIARMPDALIQSFCGVGNPFSLGEIEAGSAVLDIGCGSGFDLIVASGVVGSAGKVCGIDLTGEMIQQARKNFQFFGITNIEAIQVSSETIPYNDKTFDVVISNGVINLSPCKRELFRDIYRVLKPGGRMQFADIINEDKQSAVVGGELASWAQ